MADDRQLPVDTRPPWKRKLANLLLIFFVLSTLLSSLEPLRGLYMIFSGAVKFNWFLSVLLSVLAILSVATGFVGSAFIVVAMKQWIVLPARPDGKIFDFLLPPDDAEYRALELEIAFDRWRERYSLPKSWTLYSIHTLSTVMLYYIDRVKRGK